MADLLHEAVQEHKHLYLIYIWLKEVKGFTAFISRKYLETVRKYLVSKREGKSLEIGFNLKRRIRSNRFMLANFATATDCVLRKSTKKRK